MKYIYSFILVLWVYSIIHINLTSLHSASDLTIVLCNLALIEFFNLGYNGIETEATTNTGYVYTFIAAFIYIPMALDLLLIEDGEIVIQSEVVMMQFMWVLIALTLPFFNIIHNWGIDAMSKKAEKLRRKIKDEKGFAKEDVDLSCGGIRVPLTIFLFVNNNP